MASVGPQGVRSSARFVLFLLLLSPLLLCLSPAWAGFKIESLPASAGARGTDQLAVVGQALVIVPRGTSSEALRAALAEKNCTLLTHYTLGSGTVALVGFAAGKTVPEGLALLQTVPQVLKAEPNRLMRPLEGTAASAPRAVRPAGAPFAPLRTPNDPRYSEQFQWPLCDFPQAWDATTGTATTSVAIIDTGIDYNHEDLAAKVWINSGEIPNNGIDDDGNGYVDDVQGWDMFSDDNDPLDFMGHGTHVAGLVGAATDNGIGVAGGDWQCRLMTLKVFPDEEPFLAPDADILEAIQYAIANGAKAINLSLGGGPGSFSDAYTQPITDAFNAGVVVVIAAGNDGFTYTDDPSGWASPICNDGDLPGDNHVLGVAACDDGKVLADFSNRDASSYRFVDLVAPGVAILSTMPDDAYDFMQGTSMASPVAAGAVSLYRGKLPTQPPAQVINSIRGGCVNIDAENPLNVGLMGAGLLNIARALVDLPPGPAQNVRASDTPSDDGGSITVTWNRSVDDGAGFSDVVKYSVFRSGMATGPFTMLASVPATGRASYSLADSPVSDSTDFWYRVDTHDPAAITRSAVVGPAQARDDLAPPLVTTLTVTDTPADQGGSLALDWTGYAGSTDLDKLRIYRATAVFNDVSAMTPIVTLNDPDARGYVDNGVSNGVQYWYAVTGVDTSGNEGTVVTPTGPAEPYPNLGITFPVGLSMIALPLVPPSTDMGNILGIGGPISIQLATYNPGTELYVDYATDPSNPLLRQALGRAFWIRTGALLSVPLNGRPAPAGDFAAPMVVGWNMLGNPFSADIVFGQSEIAVAGTTEDLRTSNANGHTDSYGWAYDNLVRSYRLLSGTLPFASHSLGQNRGFFFRSRVVGSFVFKRPVGALRVTPEAPAAAATEDNWTLRIVAKSGPNADTDNFLGVSPQAAALTGIVGPPAVEGGVELSFPMAGGVQAATSFQSPGKQQSWDLQVASAQAGAEVVLSWPDLSTLPNSVRPILTDLATGRSMYLRTVPAYRFRAGGEARSFRLTLAGEGTVMLTSVSAVGGAGRGEVTYALSAAARVTVEIRSISGRLVRTVSAGDLAPAGVATVVWDGRNRTGSSAPAGVYLVRVTAESDTGQRSSVVRTLSLQR